jgi:hypothetical protein
MASAAVHSPLRCSFGASFESHSNYSDSFMSSSPSFCSSFSMKRKRESQDDEPIQLLPIPNSSQFPSKRRVSQDIRKTREEIRPYRKRKRPGEDVTFLPPSHEFDDSLIPLEYLNPHKRNRPCENLERAMVLYNTPLSSSSENDDHDEMKIESESNSQLSRYVPRSQATQWLLQHLDKSYNRPQKFLNPNFCKDVILYQPQLQSNKYTSSSKPSQFDDIDYHFDSQYAPKIEEIDDFEEPSDIMDIN